VRSYIQTGDIVAEVMPARRPAVFDGVAARLGRLLGEQPQIAWRSARQLDAALVRAPFLSLAGDPAVKLYVAFLMKRPRRVPRLPVLSAKERLELVAVAGREAFIVSRRKPSGVYGFPSLFVEETLGVAATCRNWSTVTNVARLLRQP
jgi:uncharacterized protein (DUF1697 family)